MADEAKNVGDAVVDRETDWRVLRSLDAEIAERVMGWTRHPEQMHRTDNGSANPYRFARRERQARGV